MLTNADARHAIITAIEANGTDTASRDDYDIDAIVKGVHDATGDYDVEAMDTAEFWVLVERNEIPQSSRLARRIVTHLAEHTPAGLTDFGWYDGMPDRSGGGWADDQAYSAPEPEILDYAGIELFTRDDGIEVKVGTVRMSGSPAGVQWRLDTCHESANWLPVTVEAAAGTSTGDIAPIIDAVHRAIEADR